jgi:hypothetical protein
MAGFLACAYPTKCPPSVTGEVPYLLRWGPLNCAVLSLRRVRSTTYPPLVPAGEGFIGGEGTSYPLWVPFFYEDPPPLRPFPVAPWRARETPPPFRVKPGVWVFTHSPHPVGCGRILLSPPPPSGGETPCPRQPPHYVLGSPLVTGEKGRGTYRR